MAESVSNNYLIFLLTPVLIYVPLIIFLYWLPLMPSIRFVLDYPLSIITTLFTIGSAGIFFGLLIFSFSQVESGRIQRFTHDASVLTWETFPFLVTQNLGEQLVETKTKHIAKIILLTARAPNKAHRVQKIEIGKIIMYGMRSRTLHLEVSVTITNNIPIDPFYLEIKKRGLFNRLFRTNKYITHDENINRNLWIECDIASVFESYFMNNPAVISWLAELSQLRCLESLKIDSMCHYINLTMTVHTIEVSHLAESYEMILQFLKCSETWFLQSSIGMNH